MNWIKLRAFTPEISSWVESGSRPCWRREIDDRNGNNVRNDLGRICETPEEAVVLKARADLIIALTDHIKAQGFTQAEAAKHLGV